VGRLEGQIRFPNDPSISPAHAAFRYRDGGLVVRDLRSTNGTFARIAHPAPLRDGDVIQCGEQYLRFDAPEWKETSESPAFRGTPKRAWRYRLTQILDGGREGRVHCSVEPDTTIGREDCDLNFPKDRFISGRHCVIEQRGQSYQVTDLKSRNGTFVQLNVETPLTTKDSIFIGRQLLRVEASNKD
jgi:pSer/pThr/pTyr-binding forkhead associated (FHA) protein